MDEKEIDAQVDSIKDITHLYGGGIGKHYRDQRDAARVAQALMYANFNVEISLGEHKGEPVTCIHATKKHFNLETRQYD